MSCLIQHSRNSCLHQSEHPIYRANQRELVVSRVGGRAHSSALLRSSREKLAKPWWDYANGRRKQGERPGRASRGSAVFAAPQNHRLVARIPKPPDDQNRPRSPYKRTSLYHLPLFRREPPVAKYHRNIARGGEQAKT